MDDIWGGFFLQARGNYPVVFGKASVRQDRNEHDLIIDMKAEYIGYENNMKVLASLYESADNLEQFIPERSWAAYQQYRTHFN